MALRCPLCQLPLAQQDRQWRCDNNHSFDIAKQGYVNLLPVQNKRSRQPGDDADMVAARQRFLNSGHYQIIADCIADMVCRHLPDRPITLLDAGCGDGYYSEHIYNAVCQKQPSSHLYALDISKFAVLRAAKRLKSAYCLVASSSDIPLVDNSVDIITSLFSPLPSAEFARVLRPGGLLIVASTGLQHLLTMRELLYDTVDMSTRDPAKELSGDFEFCMQQTWSGLLTLDNSEAISDLLSMTPHYWRASKARKDALCQRSQLKDTFDVDIECWQRR